MNMALTLTNIFDRTFYWFLCGDKLDSSVAPLDSVYCLPEPLLLDLGQ